MWNVIVPKIEYFPQCLIMTKYSKCEMSLFKNWVFRTAPYRGKCEMFLFRKLSTLSSALVSRQKQSNWNVSFVWKLSIFTQVAGFSTTNFSTKFLRLTVWPCHGTLCVSVRSLWPKLYMCSYRIQDTVLYPVLYPVSCSYTWHNWETLVEDALCFITLFLL